MPHRKNAITIRDVAVHAQVSVSTVSHVINGTRHVEPETEQRVRSAIEALNFRPNTLARSLRRPGTGMIGLLVPDNTNPFFAEVARVIENVGFEHGYSAILCNSDGSPHKEATYVDVLLSRQVDGLLVISTTSHIEFLNRIIRADVPVIVVDRDTNDLHLVDRVVVDNERGGYLAGEYLLAAGHRQIGCIKGPSTATPSALRIDGFRRALAERGIALPDHAVVSGDFQYASGERGMTGLIARNPHLTAVFAANDLMALGAIHALQRMGKSVPEDVSVIGFDNIPQSAASYPTLTTIAQPIEQLGQTSILRLLERIRKRETDPARIVLEPELIIRESCKTVR